MLWDLIRDFFVQHVFGGIDSLGQTYSVFGGNLHYFEEGSLVDESTTLNQVYYQINTSPDNMPYYIGLNDWLSTTATIISITIIVVLCCLFVYKIIKLIGGLIR